MKKLITIWLEDDQGPKIFFTDSSRVKIYECAIEDIKNFEKITEEKFNFEAIYILIGKNSNGFKKAYIGESDNFNQRIYDHIKDKEKDFAERVIIISSNNKDYPFSKSEMREIERSLINIFRKSDYKIANKNNGQGRELNKIDKILINNEIKTIKFGLKAVNVEIYNDLQTTVHKNEYFKDDRQNIEVYAKVSNSKKIINGVLHPDSTITILANQSFENKSGLSEQNQNLIKKLLIEHIENDKKNMIVHGDMNGYSITFINDTKFRNPTAAGYLLKGGSSWNGWKEVWREKSTDELIVKFLDIKK